MAGSEFKSKLLFKMASRNGTCGVGSCPAVLETNRGTHVVVGLRLTEKERSELLSRGDLGIYDDEEAVELPPELIKFIKSL